MLRFFRTQNPYTAIFLFILAIVLKIPALTHATVPVIETHQVLWRILLDMMMSIFGKNELFYSFLAIINIVLQAIFLNYIVNNFHFFSKRTYLPAYTYILITSLLPQWSSFNIELINNWLILILLNLIFHTYSDNNTRKVLFNIGFTFGLMFLFELQNAIFLFFIAFAISILRAYKPAEWMVTLLGIVTPIYLFAGFAYLNDSLYLLSKIFSIPIILKFPIDKQTLITLGLLMLFVIFGTSILIKYMNRMLFQIKKMWWVCLLFFGCSIFSTIGYFSSGSEIWLITLIPACFIITNIWFITKPKWIAEIANLALITAVILINYGFVNHLLK